MLKTDFTAHRQCAREQSAFNDDEGKLRLHYDDVSIVTNYM